MYRLRRWSLWVMLSCAGCQGAPEPSAVIDLRLADAGSGVEPEVSLSARVMPSRAKMGERVVVTLQLSTTRALTADATLTLFGPDGTQAQMFDWSGQALSPAGPSELTADFEIGVDDAVGVYRIAMTASRSGAASPMVTSSMPAAFEIYMAAFSCPDEQYLAQYFGNPNLSGTAVVQRCEGEVGGTWGTGAPVPGLPTDGFSARWVGQIAFSEGAHEFVLAGDDGVKLWLDGELAIDGWHNQSVTTYRATKTVTVGLHQVKLEYFENDGSAEAHLEWSPP